MFTDHLIPPQNFSISDALTAFLSDLDQLLNDISVLGLTSFVVLDANLNLLTENSTNIDYIDTIMSNGYLQLISKATRIQGNSISSIDHILTNSLQSTHDVGTLINDISDHFINFMFIPTSKTNQFH